jgi:hypothetical protein
VFAQVDGRLVAINGLNRNFQVALDVGLEGQEASIWGPGGGRIIFRGIGQAADLAAAQAKQVQIPLPVPVRCKGDLVMIGAGCRGDVIPRTFGQAGEGQVHRLVSKKMTVAALAQRQNDGPLTQRGAEGMGFIGSRGRWARCSGERWRKIGIWGKGRVAGLLVRQFNCPTSSLGRPIGLAESDSGRRRWRGSLLRAYKSPRQQADDRQVGCQ